ncbi:MAG: ATP-dependent metalloprotease, partial [Planctomycetota bacterium]
FVFYGEEENGMQGFDLGGTKAYSEETQQIIDEEVKKLIDSLFTETVQLLEDNRDKVDEVARALIKHETLDSADIDRIMKGEKVTKPTVSDLLDQERGKTPDTPRRGTVIAPGNEDDPDVQVGTGPVPSPG